MTAQTILPANTLSSGFDVANSARFNDASDTYLNKTFGSSGNRKTFTISFWIKKCVSKDHGQSDGLMILGGQQNSYPGFLLFYNRTTDTLVFRDAQASNNIKFDVRTDAKFRDLSAWSHIVIAMDTTQGTASNRIKVYINGTQTTDLNGNAASGGGTETPLYPDQNFDSQFNGNEAHYINKYATNYEDFYLCEYCFIDGQQLAADQFGEFDEDSPNIWKPIDVSGLTFGTNGFYLDFEDSSDFGNDANGSNNWTANNFTTLDQSTDTCTNNFCTMNPLDNYFASSTFSEGNLKITTNASNQTFNTGTIGLSTGKWYWEAKLVQAGGEEAIGITDIVSTGTGIYGGKTANNYSFKGNNGNIRNNDSNSSYGSAYAEDSIVSVFMDLDNNKLYFAIDGTLQNSGTGISITAPASTSTGFYFPMIGDVDSDSVIWECNFGSPSFAISSGNTDGEYGNFEFSTTITGDGASKTFKAINTKNLAEYG